MSKYTSMADVYEALKAPIPQESLKPVKIGNRAFTCIRPQRVVERLNEVFGPFGYGWHYWVESMEHPVVDNKTFILICVVFKWRNPITGEWTEPTRTFCGWAPKIMQAEDYTKSVQTHALSHISSWLGIGNEVFMGEANPRETSGAQTEPTPTGPALDKQQIAKLIQAGRKAGITNSDLQALMKHIIGVDSLRASITLAQYETVLHHLEGVAAKNEAAKATVAQPKQEQGERDA